MAYKYSTSNTSKNKKTTHSKQSKGLTNVSSVNIGKVKFDMKKSKAKQKKQKLKRNATEEQYKSFVKRLNTRLSSIEKSYGKKSHLYKTYEAQLLQLNDGLTRVDKNGNIRLSASKKAYELYKQNMKDVKNKNDFRESALVKLNRINSMDTVKERNERVRDALKEFKDDSLNPYALTLADFIENDNMIGEMGEYINEYAYSVLYVDREEDRSDLNIAVIDIMHKSHKSYRDMVDVYNFMTKQQTDPERNARIQRLHNLREQLGMNKAHI